MKGKPVETIPLTGSSETYSGLGGKRETFFILSINDLEGPSEEAP